MEATSGSPDASLGGSVRELPPAALSIITEYQRGAWLRADAEEDSDTQS